MTIHPHAEAAREQARATSGQFGTQSRTSPSAHDRVRAARAELVARDMAALVDMFDDTIPDLTGLRMVNDSEGGVYFDVRRAGAPNWENIANGDSNDEPYRFAEGGDLEDAIFEATTQIDMGRPSELAQYAARTDAPDRAGWPATLKVDHRSGEVDSIELDIDTMRSAYGKYARPAAVSRRLDELSGGETLVSASGAQLVISGEVSRSNAMPGTYAVETEFGTLYLDENEPVHVLDKKD